VRCSVALSSEMEPIRAVVFKLNFNDDGSFSSAFVCGVAVAVPFLLDLLW